MSYSKPSGSSPHKTVSPQKRSHVAFPSKQQNFSSIKPHSTANIDGPIFKKRHIYSNTDSESSDESEDADSNDNQGQDYNGNQVQASQMGKQGMKAEFSEEPRFTFDEVKDMIEKLLARQTRASSSVKASLRRIHVDDVAIEGHSPESCKQLIEQLVNNTRRVRTLQEVLIDVRDNLKKRAYTEIIHRATINGDLPKRPPSAYLLYHQDRYQQLRNENNLAAEVSKIVAEEWKTLPEKKRREYQKRQRELLANYEAESKRLGLVDDRAPKRPKTAKQLYIQSRLAESSTSNLSRKELRDLREKFGDLFDNLSQSEKAEWITQAKEDQSRYEQEKEEYVASHPHLEHSKKEKKTRANSKPKLPDPPRSALKFFLAKKMPENYDGPEADALKKKLIEKFSSLSNKKLIKYIKKAVADKERYETEVEDFKKANPGVAVPNKKENVSKEHLKLYQKMVENRPVPPSPNAYLHYCGKLLSDLNESDNQQTPVERMQLASAKWNETSSKMRRLAEKEYQADIERYIKEMDAWLAIQPEERRSKILASEPKSNPDHWRKKLNRMAKAERKIKKLRHDQHVKG